MSILLLLLLLLSRPLATSPHYQLPELAQYRIDLLREKCKENQGNISEEEINPHYFLFSPREKLTFCWSHKSGSTSVSQVFALITNSTFIIDNNLYYRLPEVLSPRLPWELRAALESSLVFTVVRHPLTRLVSAYRDKVAPTSSSPSPSWALRRLCSQLGRGEGRCRVSWQEFVLHLLASPPSTYDSHWAPLASHCQPCQVNYDLVLKVETLQSDWEVLRRLSGLEELPDLKHLNDNHNNQGTYRDYISQLSPPTLQKLYNKFRLDFELFGYSLDFY